MADWRAHAFRLFPERTKLDADLPLRDVSISPALSGPQAITASLDPDTAALETTDGRPLLEDHNTFIVIEADDVIRGGGILVQSAFTGELWALEISGFTHHPHGQAMTSTLAYGGDNAGGRNASGPVPHVGADPIAIVKDLWGQVAAKPNSDLGVTFGGATETQHKIANWRNVLNVWDYHPDASTIINIDYPQNATADDDGNYPAKTVLANVATNGTNFSKARKSGTSSIKQPTGKNIFWNHHIYFYETTDIGQKIDDYATTTPFDYIEHLEWADADKSDVVMRLDFGYPRLGSRRSNLRFVEGENIFDVIPAVTGGDEYANAVVALGAGDGKDQLRAEAFVDDERLRVEKVLTASHIADATQLKSYAAAQLNLLLGTLDVAQFTVKQHDNAKIGSFGVGDDLLLMLSTGWMAGRSLWVRVTGVTIVPDSDEIQVQCKRSDSFSYGSV